MKSRWPVGGARGAARRARRGRPRDGAVPRGGDEERLAHDATDVARAAREHGDPADDGGAVAAHVTHATAQRRRVARHERRSTTGGHHGKATDEERAHHVETASADHEPTTHRNVSPRRPGTEARPRHQRVGNRPAKYGQANTEAVTTTKTRGAHGRGRDGTRAARQQHNNATGPERRPDGHDTRRHRRAATKHPRGETPPRTARATQGEQGANEHADTGRTKTRPGARGDGEDTSAARAGAPPRSPNPKTASRRTRQPERAPRQRGATRTGHQPRPQEMTDSRTSTTQRQWASATTRQARASDARTAGAGQHAKEARASSRDKREGGRVVAHMVRTIR